MKGLVLLKQKIDVIKNEYFKRRKKYNILAILLALCMLFIIFFQQIFFYGIPAVFGEHPFFLNSGNKGDHNTGFIYPLDVVDPNDNNEYSFIYYDEVPFGEATLFYICGNSDYIKTHKNGFIVYNSAKIYHISSDVSSSGGLFYLYRDGESIYEEVNFSYDIRIDTYRYTSIYNRSYKNHLIMLNYDEMIAYCEEKEMIIPY